MRVLNLRETTGDHPALVLHAQVTVLRGLDPERHRWLVDALGRLSAGGEPTATGEVEAHGIRFDLGRDTLALLDLDRAAPAVVTSGDLPGHDARRAELRAAHDAAATERAARADEIARHRAALEAAVTERDAAQAELDELQRGEGAARSVLAEAEVSRTRIEAEITAAGTAGTEQEAALAAAVLARDVAAEARASAAERLEGARTARRAAMEAASQAAAEVEQARPVADSDPTEALAAARLALAAAEDAAAEADPDRDGSPVSRRLADLERRRTELARLQEALGEGGSGPVAGALDRLLGAGSEAPPVVAALALADTWRDLHQQVQALDAGVSPAEVAAEERVVLARRTVAEAESDFNQPVLTPEQITKVEAAHAAALEAQDRSEGRFGGSRARKKLEEVRSEERRVLERLGFSTYADYMMSSSSRGVGPANRAILEQAKGQLAAAQQELTGLPGASDRARRRQELLQRRDAVAPRVAELLGHEPTGPEAEDELRALREPVAPDERALAELAGELGSVGIMVGESPWERDDLVLLARSFLAEQQASESQRREAREALGALDDAIVKLREARQRGIQELPEIATLPGLAEPVPAAPDTDAESRALTLREARWADVEAARVAVAEGEHAVSRHREANDTLGQLETTLEACREAEEQAAAAVAAAEADVTLANGPAFDAAVASASGAEAALARSRARELDARSRLAEADGSAQVERFLEAATDRVRVAEQAVAEVAADEQATAGALAAADSAVTAAAEAEAALEAEAAAVDRAALVDDVGWALMTRLAAVRAVGLAGSVPLVLDEPFGALDDAEVHAVLDRVAGLAGAVQVVVVTNRQAAADWAGQAGEARASLVAA